MRRVIITHATAATVYRWATAGSKRQQAKYRNALTVCRVLNRREAPVLGTDWIADEYGLLSMIKLQWGYGHVRDCGLPSDDGSILAVARECEGQPVLRPDGPSNRWHGTESLREFRRPWLEGGSNWR